MNALVLIARGLHVGYVGCYGNEWVETPSLDRLAAEGIVFDQHYADQPDAAGAQRAWQTGCYRFPSSTNEAESTVPGPTSLVPLLELGGIATLQIGDRGIRSLPSASALEQALDHLVSHKQWLLKVDFGVLLPPWHVPDEFRSVSTTSDQEEEEGDDPCEFPELDSTEERAYMALQNQYAAAVTYLDSAVGQVVRALELRGLLDHMLIILTSDHGQMLGEDATRSGSRRLLHEELIHIPLIVRLPGKAEAGRRVPAFTQSVDLLPTLFDAFGVALTPVHGDSLLPLANGQKDQIREYACSGIRVGDAVEWALRNPHWALLLPVSSLATDCPAEPELYVKPDDHWEVNNVGHQNVRRTERLRQTLERFVEATRRAAPLRPPKLPDLEVESVTEEYDATTDPVERRIPP